MRTSLIETAQIEDWLFGQLNPDDYLLMEARLQIDHKLKTKVEVQQTTYDLVKLHGREILKKEIRSIDHELFNHPRHRTFRDKIFSIFKI